ncbi:MAG: DUF4003 domain-containing protein [Defluviitaleaceae bacterium]|nr:DUF4003 domain-containing protein [Defluviitaleaceae bacterium]
MNREQMTQLFLDNTTRIRKSFPWQEPMIKRLTALVFALEGNELDGAAVVAAHKKLKDSTGVFSTFRGNLAVLISAMASMTPEPAARLADTQTVYQLMKHEKFRSSDYLVAAAYEIASQAQSTNFPHIVTQTREIFLAMRANNRFLIGADDYIYAAMLALASLDAQTAGDKVRDMYTRLKAEFPFMTSRSCLLHLAQIMVLSDRTEHCISNLIHLNRILRAHKIKLDRSLVLPSLGILSTLTINPDALADEIKTTVEYLRAQKGFGAFSVTSAEINMYAVALISRHTLAQATASTAITNMLIAQQTAMMVAMSAAIITSTNAAAAGC